CQKVIDEAARTKDAPPPGTLKPNDHPHSPADDNLQPPPRKSADATPSSATNPPPPTTPDPNLPPPPPTGSTGTSDQPTVTATPSAPTAVGPLDLGVAAGADVWAAGVPMGADPSFALSISGGYTLHALSNDTVETRLGVKIGFSFLSDNPPTPKTGQTMS